MSSDKNQNVLLIPNSFDVYVCNECGRTITHRLPSNYMPNVMCSCTYPQVNYMTKCFSKIHPGNQQVEDL